MGKIGRFISKIADAVKELVSDEPVMPKAQSYPDGGREMIGNWEGAPSQVYPPVPLTTTRTFLPMKSRDKDYNDLRIAPGKSFAVVARPQAAAFRVEEIVIIGDPDAWMIEDIKVGHRSQFVQAGDIPGSVFARGVDNGLRLDTCQTAMDFTIVAKYIGKNPEGEIFEAKVTGTAAN